MDSEIKDLKRALVARQNELKKLIHQMKSDQLNRSSLYRNMENELLEIKQKLQHQEDLPK
jgi:hypothetical protein